MNFDRFLKEILNHKNEEEAAKMSAYMLNKFKLRHLKEEKNLEIFLKSIRKIMKNQEK